MLLIRTHSWQQSLWATEQALRCPAIGAVLSWPTAIIDKNVRRLQLAAEAGGSLGFLYRPPAAALESSPAALRLRLHAAPDEDAPSTRTGTFSGSTPLIVEIQKSRGGRAGLRLCCRNPNEPSPQSRA
jgi:hypothetical protein